MYYNSYFFLFRCFFKIISSTWFHRSRVMQIGSDHIQTVFPTLLSRRLLRLLGGYRQTFSFSPRTLLRWCPFPDEVNASTWRALRIPVYHTRCAGRSTISIKNNIILYYITLYSPNNYFRTPAQFGENTKNSPNGACGIIEWKSRRDVILLCCYSRVLFGDHRRWK